MLLRNLRPGPGITMPPWSYAGLGLSFDISTWYIKCKINCLDRCGICGQRFRKDKSILILVLRVLKDRCLTWVFLDSMEALQFRALVIIFLSVCVYGCVSIANFVKYLKNALLALLGQRTITHTCSFIYCFNMG